MQMKPTCQPVDINVNTGASFAFVFCFLAMYLCSTDIFTNQTGLIYTLTNVWQPDNNTLGALSSSLTYLNNTIQNCLINNIQVDFESEDRSGSQFSFAMWGQNVLVGHFTESAGLQRLVTEQGIHFLQH